MKQRSTFAFASVAALGMIVLAGCASERLAAPVTTAIRKVKPLVFRYPTAEEMATRAGISRTKLGSKLGLPGTGLSANSFSAQGTENDCDVGSIACAYLSTDGGGGIGWDAYTETTALYSMPMSIFGIGKLQRGTTPLGIHLFTLECLRTGTTHCEDSDFFNDSCEDEPNTFSAATNHTVVWNLTTYSRSLSTNASCVKQYDDHSEAGTFEDCTNEPYTVEVYNPTTGNWDYWGTRYAEVCV